MATPDQPRHGDVDFQCQPLCPICRGADLLRAVAPPELQEELHDLQRELLLAVRDLATAAVQVMDQRAARAGAEGTAPEPSATEGGTRPDQPPEPEHNGHARSAAEPTS